MSSIYYNSNTYGGHKCVDGLHYGQTYMLGTLCHTLGEKNPWWKVDLGGEHCITGVNLQGRPGKTSAGSMRILEFFNSPID